MKRSPWRYLWSAQDIRRKLLITFMILVIYRFAAHVPVPGADLLAIQGILSRGGAGGTLLGLLDLLSGGTVSNFSVLAMGVYPYITAQIILQLLVPIIPSWQQRMQDDPREGQKWMERWTLILAVPMAALQAVGQINIFNSFSPGTPIISNFGFATAASTFNTLTIVISMTAGTMFAIWLGELISEFGIRNQGLSIIIFAGIVARIPSNLYSVFVNKSYVWQTLLIIAIVLVGTIFAIVVVQQGRRNIPVMYPGRRMGNRMSMPVKGTLPLMVNMAGMIPLIFAQSLLTFPAILASFFTQSTVAWVKNVATSMQAIFGGGSTAYWILYFLMVVGFTFFYTNVLFQQQNYGENLKKVGARIPGVSPGAPTQRYLNRVLSRITFPGALFLGLIAVMPWLLSLIFPFMQSSSSTLLITGAGLLIVVGVVRDLFFNLEAELKLHGYDDAVLIR
ncbi:MAG: secY [Chloroflexi bacterium]|nr:secY [Chloroflexota bacterium]